jgi:hypothetical protein
MIPCIRNFRKFPDKNRKKITVVWGWRWEQTQTGMRIMGCQCSKIGDDGVIAAQLCKYNNNI